MSAPPEKAGQPGTPAAEIKNGTGTAFIVAEFRVGENHFDDRLDAQLRQCFRQVVILGAGLDTWPIRDDWKSPDLYLDYRPDARIDTPLYGFYSLCTLERAG